MREDEGALREDEADGELEDEEEALHMAGLADTAVIPVEAARLVIAEAFLLVHPVAVLGGPNLAAIATGRNSIGNEIEAAYFKIAEQRLHLATRMPRAFGAMES